MSNTTKTMTEYIQGLQQTGKEVTIHTTAFAIFTGIIRDYGCDFLVIERIRYAPTTPDEGALCSDLKETILLPYSSINEIMLDAEDVNTNVD